MKKTFLFTLIAVLVSHAAFSVISGTLTVCAGGTSTVSGTPTGSGGVWSSSNPAIANIYFYDSVSATVSGIVAGTATITYTIGSTSSTAIVTVNPAAFVDSILGPNAVCVGSTISLSNSVAGGTWTAPDYIHTSISSAGVVTGVAAGSTSVLYTVGGACPGSKWHFMIVTTSTMPGSIYGAFGIAVGGTTSLSAFITGGTWSSGNPAVATIGSTAVVTGIAPGTATISYTVSGCTGIASSTEIVTVNPISEGISGNVLFTTPYYGGVKVWLIRYNPATFMLDAVDSTVVSGSGLGAYYQFTGLSTDSFRVKAAQLSPAPGGTFMPTYYNSSFYWHSAAVIYHTAGASDVSKDINMVYGYPTTGPGFIGGSVLTGANKGTSDGVPVTGMAMVLVNSITGNIVQFTRTDASGIYMFNNLPNGTYHVFPDSVNYLTTPYTGITISSTSVGMTAGNFIQGTLSKTIKPKIPTSIQPQIAGAYTINVFPNPADEQINISVSNAKDETATIAISDISGRNIFNEAFDIRNQQELKGIDISSFNAGIYFLQIKSATINHRIIVAIKH